MPRVSVVTVAYNAEPYIAQAIESVLRQTESDLEMVIVDNASADGTRGVIEQFAGRDARVRLVPSGENLGAGQGRNVGMRAAAGDWLAILDADDWFEPERLERLLAAADRERAELVADNQFFVMDGAAEPYRLMQKKQLRGDGRLTADDVLRGDRFGKTGNLGLLKPVLRRHLVERHGIEYDATPAPGEDFYFLLKCLRHTPFLWYTAEPMYHYRIHRRSMSHSLSIDAVHAIRTLHDGNAGLFDPADAPATARLMRRRGREIDRYIRYRVLVDPLKRGDVGEGLRRIIADPAAVPMLAEGLLRHVVHRHHAGAQK